MSAEPILSDVYQFNGYEMLYPLIFVFIPILLMKLDFLLFAYSPFMLFQEVLITTFAHCF